MADFKYRGESSTSAQRPPQSGDAMIGIGRQYA